MNVKQLKDYISELPDDMEVTVSDGKGWLYRVDDMYRTLTKDSRGYDTSVAVIQPIYSLEEIEECPLNDEITSIWVHVIPGSDIKYSHWLMNNPVLKVV